MRWMLDTNTLVYVLNARPQHQRVLDRFNEHDSQKLCLSSITLAELRFGVAQSQRRDETQKKLDRVIGALTVMPFEDDAAMAYGVLRAALQAEGQPIGPLDTLIAGHALSEGATLVTNNLREFSRVKGLRLENWIEPT
jgi:tRNA(fMet)-specific endonuclease VapC